MQHLNGAKGITPEVFLPASPLIVGDRPCPSKAKHRCVYLYKQAMSPEEEKQTNQISRVILPSRPGVRATADQDNLFQIMWRGKWIILCTSLLGLACTHFYLKNQVKMPLYRSRAAILIDKPQSISNADVPQPVGGTASNYLQTHASMITSRTIITAALRDPNVSTLPSLADANNPAGYIQKVLSADLVKKTDILNISAATPYPIDSAVIVNSVIKAYIQWHDTNKRATTADLLRDLNQQLDRRQKELTSRREALAVFEKKMMAKSQGSSDSDLLSEIRRNMETVRMSEMQLVSYHDGLLRFKNDPGRFRQYVNNRHGSVNIEIPPDQRAQIEKELEDVRSQLEEFEAGGVAVRRSQVELLKNKAKRLEDKIANIEREFITEHLSLIESLRDDTQLHLKLLNETYEEKLAKAIGHSEWDSERSRLVSECQMSEKICNSLLDQINQLDLGENLQNLSIHVLEEAVRAEDPVPSDDIRTYALGLIMGLISGAGLTALGELKDKRIKSSDEITRVLGLPILGTVPNIKKRGFVSRSQRLRFAPNSSESEAYRRIRTSILFGAPGEQPTTLLVTSAMAAEGKTTLVSNLGIAMAQAGKRTIILDADLRKPQQQRIFMGNNHGLGLVDVLNGTAPLEEAVRRSETPGLDVLGSGKNPTNPSELLNSPEFADVLQQLKEEYAIVLIDSSPVALVTDAQIIATFCDLTLLVLRAGKSTRPCTQQARDALYSVGVRSVGCVVNDVSKGDTRFGYYRGHGYGYYSQVDTSRLAIGGATEEQVHRPKRRKKVTSEIAIQELPPKKTLIPLHKQAHERNSKQKNS